MVRNLALFVILALLLAVAAGEADFVDYRGMLFNTSPETFESSASLHSQYPNSVTIFYKSRPILWEAAGVRDFSLYNGELDAVLQNDITYLYNNACGGIVAPNGTESAFVYGDFLVLSTPERHFIYGIADCAQYNHIRRLGDMLAYSAGNELICEASPTERFVRTALTGMVLYSDITSSQTKAVYGDANGCYFIQRDGSVDMYSADGRVMSEFAHIDDLVLSANAHDGGFAGFAASGFFRADIQENGGVYVEYSPVPKGYCTDASDSFEPICEEDLSSAFGLDLVNSFKRAITADTLYLLSDERLRAYGRTPEWTKRLVTSYSLPAPCADGDDIYFNDLFGNIFKFSINDAGRTIYTAEDYPEYCNGFDVSYRDGKFVMWNGSVVYTFGELVRTEGRRVMYKRTEGDRVLYFLY